MFLPVEVPQASRPADIQTVRRVIGGGLRLPLLWNSLQSVALRPGTAQVCARRELDLGCGDLYLHSSTVIPSTFSCKIEPSWCAIVVACPWMAVATRPEQGAKRGTGSWRSWLLARTMRSVWWLFDDISLTDLPLAALRAATVTHRGEGCYHSHTCTGSELYLQRGWIMYSLISL